MLPVLTSPSNKTGFCQSQERSMLGMRELKVSLLPKLDAAQTLGRQLIWKQGYESRPLNALKPEWLVLVILLTSFTPWSNLASVKGQEILSLRGSIKNSGTYMSISPCTPSSISCQGDSRNRWMNKQVCLTDVSRFSNGCWCYCA